MRMRWLTDIQAHCKNGWLVLKERRVNVVSKVCKAYRACKASVAYRVKKARKATTDRMVLMEQME